MLFLESDFSVKLISVFSPSWQAVNTAVAPRTYNALSFRLKGDAEFTGQGSRVRVADNDILFMPENVANGLKTESGPVPGAVSFALRELGREKAGVRLAGNVDLLSDPGGDRPPKGTEGAQRRL